MVKSLDSIFVEKVGKVISWSDVGGCDCGSHTEDSLFLIPNMYMLYISQWKLVASYFISFISKLS